MRQSHIPFSVLPSKMPSSSATKPRKHTTTSAVTTTSTTPQLLCRHHTATATATLDLLFLILVLISGTFLLTSYFSYLFTSLSLLLPHLSLPPLAYSLSAAFSLLFLSLLALCGGTGSRRKCGKPGCKGLKKALEFDLQLQNEECLRSSSLSSMVPTNYSNSSNGGGGISQVDIEKLPWKGGSEKNPDYECLRAELRKMAPPNGRAVLLFRAKCGCPVSKLVGWGPKKGRKHRKALASTTVNGDHH